MSSISTATASQPVYDLIPTLEARATHAAQATRPTWADPAMQGPPIVPMGLKGYPLNDLVSTPQGKLVVAGVPADLRSRAPSAPKPTALSAQSIEAARAKWDQQSAGHAESTKLKWEARAAYGLTLLRTQEKGPSNAPLKVAIHQIQWTQGYDEQVTRQLRAHHAKSDAALGRISLFAHSYGATKSALLELARLSGRPLGEVVINSHGTEGVGPAGVKFFNPAGKVASSFSGQRYDGYRFPEIAKDLAQLGVIGQGSTLVSHACNTVREKAGQAGFQAAADSTGATLVGSTDVIYLTKDYLHTLPPFKTFTPRTR